MKSYFYSKRQGRPRVGNVQLGVRLPPELVAKLDSLATNEGMTKSQLVARWIKSL
jgi:predicted DNA-binding protein